MSNKQQELMQGVVRQAPFLYPAIQRIHFPDVEFMDEMEKFHQFTSRVVRVKDLSQPMINPHYNSREELCKKAHRVVQKVLQQEHGLREKRLSFTIIDGTPYEEVVASANFGMDICYINVFWKDDNLVTSVMLAARMWRKTTKVWHVEDRTTRLCHTWSYTPDATEEQCADAVRFSIERLGNQQMNFLFSETVFVAQRETCLGEVEYPVASAVLLDDIVWYASRPYRHFHILHSLEYTLAFKTRLDQESKPIQGFVTNHGNFINRYRAMALAVENRMIIGHNGAHVDYISSKEKGTGYGKAFMATNGIYQEKDKMIDGGYRISRTPLFSEDLW